MHQLHIHTCYITYPIDLKSPLFTFILHTTFLLNKVWPKNCFRISTYIQHYKVIWRSMNACIAWCPQWYIFRTMNLYILILYIKVVIIKRNEEHLSLHRIPPPPVRPFHVCTQTISRSSRSKPPAHSRMFHLSLAIYTSMITIFEAKARYVDWT